MDFTLREKKIITILSKDKGAINEQKDSIGK